MNKKYKVLVSDKLSETGLDILRGCPLLDVDVKTGMTPEELIKTIPDYDGIIIRSGTKVTAKVIEAAKKLKIVGRAGAGVDNVDIPEATKKGIAVENTPGGNTVTTAEHTISLMCALARNIPQGTASVKSGEWNRKLTGVELMGKTLGVVGIGRVGSIVVNRAQGFRMRCIAFDPFISKDKAEELGVELVELDEVWKRSDFISVHSPLTDATRGMIGAPQFAKMKKSVRIINCARGGIIDEAALAEAIKSGQVAGAALDVFEKEPPAKDNQLTSLPQVICTPHLGASTGEAQENVALAVARQMVAFFQEGVILNAVNVPPVDPELLKKIEPYLKLAEKMGSFISQISGHGVREIEIASSGEIADIDMKPLANSVLRGFLAFAAGEEVNFINAPIVAQERGIEVKTTVSSKVHDFIGLLTVKVLTDEGEQFVSGTIFGKKEPRIVNIDSVHIEAEPEGYMLVFTNRDKPGVIGRIGGYLGSKEINIGQFRLGRSGPMKNAVCIVNIDSPLTQEMLDDIKGISDVLQAWMVKL
ncbi:MAG: D-3-phosphoglycerate dehydrogenase [bacterium]|nr:MAG: D-3-phosphoglycerate dehydrogenase [bacterium]